VREFWCTAACAQRTNDDGEDGKDDADFCSDPTSWVARPKPLESESDWYGCITAKTVQVKLSSGFGNLLAFDVVDAGHITVLEVRLRVNQTPAEDVAVGGAVVVERIAASAQAVWPCGLRYR